jgi:hypothetical protein
MKKEKMRLKRIRIGPVGAWLLATSAAVAAVYCYGECFGNGMAAGDWIGLRGREHDVAEAQAAARRWFDHSLMCQAGVAASLFATLKIGMDADPIPRYVSRVIVAALVSIPFTLLVGTFVLVGTLLFEAFRLATLHHR